MALSPGTRFDSYELGPLLGSGGMGEVYRARDVQLGRPVAIKVLRPESASHKDRLARFEREARTASALNHPNIVTIYGVGDIDAMRYIAMEFVEGRTIRQLLERGPIPLPDLLHYATQMAEALAKAHAGNIVHRDLKPENLMVTSDGLVKILDFGLAKLSAEVSPLSSDETSAHTAAGVLLGTVQYMSPEQARTPQVDFRSDQFSLGLILYEMATGRRAFARDSLSGTVAAIMFDEPIPATELNPAVPEGLQQVITTCLQKDPKRRFATTSELARLLSALKAEPSFVVGESQTLTRIGTQPPASQRPSVAVLPFVDMSPQKDQEYFCDGMAEELINALTQVSGLRVVSRTSSFQFKGKVDDVRAIGQRLSVSTLLEGSVRTAGDRMRIGARLTNVADGYQLWSSQYDRDMKDVFAVQDEITGSILAALRVTLIKAKDAPIVQPHTGNPEVYKLYLKGRHEWNKRTEEGLLRSLEFFQEAIERDPGYSRAHAGLADSYVLLGVYGIRPPSEVMPKAKATATRALEEAAEISLPGQADTGLAAVYTTLACVKAVYEWSWAEAERDFRQAIERDPKYPTAHHWYAMNCLVPQRRFEEATREIRLAQETDPLSPVIQTSLGLVHYFAGRLVEAAAEIKKTLDADGSFAMAHFFLGQTYLQMQRADDALAALGNASRLSPSSAEFRAGLGNACALAGQTERARRILGELKERRKEGYVSAALVAEVHAGLGEADEALSWIEQAVKERSPELSWIGVRPAFSRLRSNPRFLELVRPIGLATA
jgi:serine/threonine protein kinase/tetratricopeptide (TPR) repeat protein